MLFLFFFLFGPPRRRSFVPVVAFSSTSDRSMLMAVGSPRLFPVLWLRAVRPDHPLGDNSVTRDRIHGASYVFDMFPLALPTPMHALALLNPLAVDCVLEGRLPACPGYPAADALIGAVTCTCCSRKPWAAANGSGTGGKFALPMDIYVFGATRAMGRSGRNTTANDYLRLR
jgi:hypothetical protein